ncbi:helix-turn-helix domain-containing protein [Kingella kingae]|uniref:helix-turn-helix domain-containing protein n=1 Tax=Kingella kingae TaxID=504 RepID=UPI0004012188|nr:helix-turn-helix domain-containing protein [Kingella kingae]
MQPINPKDKPYPFKKGSQCDRIVQYLLTGRRIKNYEIREEFCCYSHAARISEIRAHGFAVQAVLVDREQGIFEYWLPQVEGEK